MTKNRNQNSNVMKRITIFISIVFAANFLVAQWYKHPQFGSSSPDKQHKDIFFADENNGWAVGFGWPSYRTTDGGSNWEWMDENELWYINSVFFSDPYNGWAVGDNAYIVHTDNGGIDWVEQESGIEDHDLRSVYFVDSLKGWAVGGYIFSGWVIYPKNVIITTSDGGITWEIQDESTQGIFSDVFFLDDSIGWAIQIMGGLSVPGILRTNNGGNTWEEINDSIGGNSMFFLDDITGYIAGGMWDYSTNNHVGWILKTIDGGYSWSRILKDTIPILKDIIFTDSLNGYAVGYSGSILHTQDAGETWSYQESSTSAKLNSICFTDENHGWICGDSNHVLYTNNGGTVSLNESVLIEKEFHIYPNPCKEHINIAFDLENAANIECKIIDIGGRVLYHTSLGNSATKHETLDMSRFPAGVYFIRLENHEGNLIKKIIKAN
jgi:photosystem II stability/assembly factor-like uncharacterized protein